MAKFEELEEVHAELKLKQALWNSLVEWDDVTGEWLEVGVTLLHSFFNMSFSLLLFSC